MAQWKLQYRSTGTTYIDIVFGPDPTVLPTIGNGTTAPVGPASLFALTAKKWFIKTAEQLNSIESGAPLIQNLKRAFTDLEQYECTAGSGAALAVTTVKAKFVLIAAAASIEESPTSPIRTSAFGVLPITARSLGMEEDRGNLTSLGVGLGYGVNERREWRVILA